MKHWPGPFPGGGKYVTLLVRTAVVRMKPQLPGLIGQPLPLPGSPWSSGAHRLWARWCRGHGFSGPGGSSYPPSAVRRRERPGHPAFTSWKHDMCANRRAARRAAPYLTCRMPGEERTDVSVKKDICRAVPAWNPHGRAPGAATTAPAERRTGARRAGGVAAPDDVFGGASGSREPETPPNGARAGRRMPAAGREPL